MKIHWGTSLLFALLPCFADSAPASAESARVAASPREQLHALREEQAVQGEKLDRMAQDLAREARQNARIAAQQEQIIAMQQILLATAEQRAAMLAATAPPVEPGGELAACMGDAAAAAAVAKLSDPATRATLTAEEQATLQQLVANCTAQKICRTGSDDQREACKSSVNRDRERLALLLRIAAIAALLTQNYELAAALFSLSGAVGNGGDDGEGEHQQSGKSTLPGGACKAGDPGCAETGGDAPAAQCDWCSQLDGVTATSRGQMLTVTWPDGGNSHFNLGNIQTRDGARLQLDPARDELSADVATKRLQLRYCGGSLQGTAAGTYRGNATYLLKAASDARVDAQFEDSIVTEGGACKQARR